MKPFRLLVVDDDPDDRLLLEEAMELCEMDLELVDFVEDGEDAIAFLKERDGQASRALSLPSLVLLDWNMPRMGGREVLQVMKDSQSLNTIPVVVLTTSSRPADIRDTYALGGRSFIVKPTSFDGLVGVVRQMKEYWQNTVALP